MGSNTNAPKGVTGKGIGTGEGGISNKWKSRPRIISKCLAAGCGSIETAEGLLIFIVKDIRHHLFKRKKIALPVYSTGLYNCSERLIIP
jgi:hypothetical protein